MKRVCSLNTNKDENLHASCIRLNLKLIRMKFKNVLEITAMLAVVFFSGCKKDDNNNGDRPTVTSTSPIANATSIAINSKISTTFSMAMNSSTISVANFTVKDGATVIAGTIKYSGTTATFTPSANLTPNTIYVGTISTGVKNSTGQALASNYSWTFTTGVVSDLTIPTVLWTNPSNNENAVSLNHLLTASFSKIMDQSSFTSSTFTLKQESNLVAGTVSCSGAMATFKPAANLLPNKIYTATITNGVMDMIGHAMTTNYAFSFTTGDALDTKPPTVLSTDPLNNALGIDRNKVIAITFSEAIDPSTISTSTFTLKQGTISVAGSVSYSGTTATFTPTNILVAGAVYTATVTNSVKDIAGNALASNNTWSFTTNDTKAKQAVVNLGTAGDYVILAKTSINNISTSTIIGDLGLSPSATSYVTGFALTNATGFATSAQITGKIFAADMVAPTSTNLTTAVNNMLTAYTDAAGRPTPDFTELGTGNIGGRTLVPGLYKWTSTVTIPSDITISGDATDVWIFQISGNLSMSSAVKITLIGGAQAKNIFWQVAGEATLGTTSHFEGIILSKTGITFKTAASINGRALAQTAVILDSNAVTKP